MGKIGLLTPTVIILFLGAVVAVNWFKSSNGLTDANASSGYLGLKTQENENNIIDMNEPVFTRCKIWKKNIHVKICENSFQVCTFDKTGNSCFRK